jgi:hypothetical protein
LNPSLKLEEVKLAKISVTAGVKHIIKISTAYSSLNEDLGSSFYNQAKAELDISLVDGIALTVVRFVNLTYSI